MIRTAFKITLVVLLATFTLGLSAEAAPKKVVHHRARRTAHVAAHRAHVSAVKKAARRHAKARRTTVHKPAASHH